MRVDVRESNGEYRVSAEVPGVKKDDIQVEIDGNPISISAAVQHASEESEGERVLARHGDRRPARAPVPGGPGRRDQPAITS